MKGFTIVELLVVITIVAIIFGYSSPLLSSYIVRNNWHLTVDRIGSELAKAQGYAMSGKTISGSMVWGVCQTGNIVRMFNGSCSTPNTKEDFTVSNNVTVSGLTGITFSNLRGEPNATASISVVTSLGSNNIVINSAGMIQVN